jgi:hypothetical protein
MPNYIGRIDRAKYERSVKELTSIAKASVDYFNSEGAWPAGVSQLAPEFMPSAVTSSPFGTNYQIAGVNDMVTVSVLIPTGIAQKDPQGALRVIVNQGNRDLIEITQQLPNEFSGRLEYEKKYQYMQ